MTQYLGLSQKEAQKNRVEYGDNLLEGGQKKSALKILLAQFGDLMTLILLCSTILSMVMGEKVEAMTIIAIVILNALMGFFQEYRTERSLQKLGELAAPSATVIRDGHSRVIPAKEVTIGDLVVLKAGDRVPADCRIVENSELSIDESLLTGECRWKRDAPTTAPTITASRCAPLWGRLCCADTARRWSTESAKKPAWEKSQ